MYKYEDYEISETATSYRVTEAFNDEFEVKVKKSTIEKLQIDEDPKEVAVLIAVIEFIRNQNCAFDRKKDIKIIEKEDFAKNLRVALNFVTIESLIFEISQMKYYEVKEFFL